MESRSDLMEAQLSALLDEIEFHKYDDEGIRALLTQLREVLLSAEPKAIDVSTHPKSLPLRGFAKSAVSSPFQWMPPTAVDVVGSFMTATMCKPSTNIDISVQMSAEMFKEKDVKDFGYMDKRALFLGGLASLVESTGLFAAVQLEAHNGDLLRPILTLTPHKSATSATTTGDGSKRGKLKHAEASAPKVPSGIRVRLIPSLPFGVFSFGVLRPFWSNIRTNTLLQHAKQQTDGKEGLPSTYYNCSIAEDAAGAVVSRVLALSLRQCTAATQAVLTLKSWLRRAALHRADDGISGLAITAIVAFLIQQRVLTKAMTPLQAFRAVLQFLAKADLQKTPIVLQTVSADDGADVAAGSGDEDGSEDDDDDHDDDGGEDEGGSDADGSSEVDAAEDALSGSEAEGGEAEATGLHAVTLNKETLAEFQSAFPVCVLLPLPYHDVVDGTSRYTPTINICYNVSAAAFADLKEAAQRAIAGLLGSGAGAPALPASVCFERLFGQTFQPAQFYDRIIAVPLPSPPTSGAAAVDAAKDIAKHGAWFRVVRFKLQKLLQEALTTRVASVRVFSTVDQHAHVKDDSASTLFTQEWFAPDPTMWDLRDDFVGPSGLAVAVRLNHTDGAAERLVDRGPAPENVAEANKYKDLWGPDFCELRRFADGSVVYAMVWNADKLSGRVHSRGAIVPLIVSHIASRHLQVQMPHGLLHAGDRICADIRTVGGAALVDAADSEVLASGVAAASFADVASVCPSTALERILDVGGHSVNCTQVVATVDFKAKHASTVTKAAAQSSLRRIESRDGKCDLMGKPMDAADVAILTSNDPLARGPQHAVRVLNAAFDFVLGAIKGVRGMPLSVLTADAVSPQFRGTALQVEGPNPLAAFVAAPSEGDEPTAASQLLTERALLSVAHASMRSCSGIDADDEAKFMAVCQTMTPMEVVLHLESSGKWPDDPLAIAAMKSAFLLKLKYGLTSSFKGVLQTMAHPDHLDVLCGGFCFRFYLQVPREVQQLEKLARRTALTGGVVSATIRGDEGILISDKTHKGFVAVAPAGLHDPEAPTKKKKQKNQVAPSGLGALSTTDLMSLSGLSARGVSPGMLATLSKNPGADLLAPASTTEGTASAGLQLGVPARTTDRTYLATVAFKKAITAGGSTAALDADTAGILLDGVFAKTVALPRHAAVISAVASKYAAYSGSVRLVKAWLLSQGFGLSESSSGTNSVASLGAVLRGEDSEDVSSAVVATVSQSSSHAAAALQHLGAMLSNEVIELTVAYLFTQPFPFPVPGSPAVAYLRWLQLIAAFDWENEPMLVDVDGTASDVDYRTLYSRFKAIRAEESGSSGHKRPRNGSHASVGPAMYIVTPLERANWKPLWTRTHPTPAALTRLRTACKSSFKILASALLPVLPIGRCSEEKGLDGMPVHSSSIAALAESTAAPFIPLALRSSCLPRSHWSIGFGGALHDSVNAAVAQATLGSKHSAEAYLAARPEWDASVVLRRSMVPRHELDGRYFGAVKRAIACAAEVAAVPVIAGLKYVNNKPRGKTGDATARVWCAVGGTVESSNFSVPLFKNLLETSRADLLFGFDPLECYLHTLRSRMPEADFALDMSVGPASGDIGAAHCVSLDSIRMRVAGDVRDVRALAVQVAECCTAGAGLVRNGVIGDA